MYTCVWLSVCVGRYFACVHMSNVVCVCTCDVCVMGYVRGAVGVHASDVIYDTAQAKVCVCFHVACAMHGVSLCVCMCVYAWCVRVHVCVWCACGVCTRVTCAVVCVHV